jgi:hypothetical protein
MTKTTRIHEGGGTATTTGKPAGPKAPASSDAAKLAGLVTQYGCGPQLTGGENALHERHLIFDNYLEADRRLIELYGDPDAWAEKVILNVAASGKFSSDRTIADYAREIWNAKPCPVF